MLRRKQGTRCWQTPYEGSDWLVFYFPMSALGNVYPVGGFPFDSAKHESWRIPLDNWLVDIARRIFPRAPFVLGLVGLKTFCFDAAQQAVASRCSRRPRLVVT